MNEWEQCISDWADRYKAERDKNADLTEANRQLSEQRDTLRREHAAVKEQLRLSIVDQAQTEAERNDLERENQRLREALGECIKTFDYLVFHRVAGMDALLYESHNRTSPGRTVEATKRLAHQALHAARPGEVQP